MNDTPSSAGLALTANPPGRRVVRGVLWTALVLLIVFGAYAWQARDRSDRVQYRTEPAQRGNLVVTVTATGSLAPTNQVDVGIEISGTVRAVDPGLREAAANLGATPGFARRALERPALLRAMLAAALQMRSAYLSRLRAISMRWISSVPPPMRVWRSSR